MNKSIGKIIVFLLQELIIVGISLCILCIGFVAIVGIFGGGTPLVGIPIILFGILFLVFLSMGNYTFLKDDQARISISRIILIIIGLLVTVFLGIYYFGIS